jgi:uracil-DNA glycosylase
MMTLPNDWLEVLKDEIEKDYFKNLMQKLKTEYQTKTIYPKKEDVFSAFSYTPYHKVKVVIIGQDPYHQKNQAHGLSFSVQRGVTIPRSLKNIYKELEKDVHYPVSDNGNLEEWAKQGVLLLNTILTVEDSKPGSHKNIGWEEFTTKVIEAINEKEEPVVFLLWGNFAKSYKPLINTQKHFVLEAAHPSPFSASQGFFKCKHFSKTNELLQQTNQTPICWQITPLQEYVQKEMGSN